MIYDYSEGDLSHAINIMQATASLGIVNEENVKAWHWTHKDK